MKCPKCGYLGFETMDRCRNCGYDFSLAEPLAGPELPLRLSLDEEPRADLELRNPDVDGSAEDAALLHEREAAGFGRVERRKTPPAAIATLQHRAADAVPGTAAQDDALEDEAAELPLFAPPRAGTPLAVRRPGPEVPRTRRPTSRPRAETPALPLVPESSASEQESAVVSAPAERPPAGLGRRALAGFIDLALLAGIDVVVVWLTLRISGLSPTTEDLRVIRPIPMVAFLMVMAFLYLTGFTLGGGQTIGKMLTRIRVTGDDGRGVDITGAVVRALGYLAGIATCGLLFAPAFVGTERRGIHDRLAGTRVVNG